MFFKRVFKWIDDNKKYFVSLISLIIFIQLLAIIIFRFVSDNVPKVESTNAVDYATLRKYFPSYTFFFLTTQSVFIMSGVGIFYCIFYKSNFWKTIFFCSISYLIFDLFALTVFNWDTIKYDPYNAYESLSCHLEDSILSILILLWIRKDIFLKWKAMIIMSFYLLIFYALVMIVYYSVTYVDNLDNVQHIKIYEFLDFNKKVIIFPTNTLVLRIVVNAIFMILCPLASMIIFFVYKFVFNIGIEKINLSKKLTI